MANESPSNLRKYGVPFYAAAWVPHNKVRSKPDSDSPNESENHDPVVFTGGGGEGRSGIPNAVVLCHADIASNSLSEPVAKLLMKSDLPYRMTVHPGGDGLICAFANSCRLYKWEEVENAEVNEPAASGSGKVLAELEDAGQQLGLAFNPDGSVLATGCEEGTVRVFKWPSMKIILNEAKAHGSVKDLTFSSDGKFLVSLGGPLCRVWDVTTATAIATLAKGKDELFAFCRFSQREDNKQVLYVAANTDRGGIVITWDTTSWTRKHSKQVIREPLSAFNVSADGDLLAVGTIQGDVYILNSTSLRIQTVVKKAHLGIVTALAFSHDSRALISASMDSSARITLTHDTTKGDGSSIWAVLFVLFLAIAVFWMKIEGIIL